MKMRFDNTSYKSYTSTQYLSSSPLSSSSSSSSSTHHKILLQCMKLQTQSKGNSHAAIVEGFKHSSIVLNSNGYHRSADSCCDRWSHIDPSFRSPEKDPFTENEDQIIINHIISIGNIIITLSSHHHYNYHYKENASGSNVPSNFLEDQFL